MIKIIAQDKTTGIKSDLPTDMSCHEVIIASKDLYFDPIAP
jgi:hypothetical protein